MIYNLLILTLIFCIFVRIYKIEIHNLSDGWYIIYESCSWNNYDKTYEKKVVKHKLINRKNSDYENPY